MKRFLAIIILSVILVGCGSKLPKYMNQQTYDLVMQAIPWCERYDEGKITVEELKKEIDKINDEVTALELSDNMESLANLSISSALRAISSASWQGNASFYEGYDKLKEYLAR